MRLCTTLNFDEFIKKVQVSSQLIFLQTDSPTFTATFRPLRSAVIHFLLSADACKYTEMFRRYSVPTATATDQSAAETIRLRKPIYAPLRRREEILVI